MKLLIADDDQTSGILLANYAKTQGFEPTFVQNGIDAYRELSREDGPTMALLDWIMPGMTGIEVIKQLRSRHRHGKIHPYLIVLTAKNDRHDIVNALRAGADDYIIKPFDPDELKARLEAGRRIVDLTHKLAEALDKSRRLTDFIAHFDQTTTLPNHLSLIEELKKVSNRPGYALYLLNIDRFKHINQFYGIEGGDIILKNVAMQLCQTTKPDAFVARRAADEFAIILPLGEGANGNHRELLLSFAENIHSSFHNPVQVKEYQITLTVSIGATTTEDKPDTGYEEYIRRAEFALKQAKEKKGNCTIIYDPIYEQKIKERYLLKKELEQGVKKDEIVMFLQPQFSAHGEPVAVEALARWQHPEKGLVPPGIFIPIAEEDDIIIKIGGIIFKKACMIIAETPGRTFTISVNISPRQFKDPQFTDFIKSILEQTGANPSRIVLELTEGILIENVESIIKRMNELAEIGINFSIDDFGTGYSSLMYLKRLPIKEVKIDRAFIQELPHDKNDAVIVETIVAIAKNLGFHLVAEGVEKREQIDFLTSRGDMSFQGYYFSRPEPASIIMEKFFT
jgi:diguanylate cyclase (GGDEF)-like protein